MSDIFEDKYNTDSERRGRRRQYLFRDQLSSLRGLFNFLAKEQDSDTILRLVIEGSCFIVDNNIDNLPQYLDTLNTIATNRENVKEINTLARQASDKITQFLEQGLGNNTYEDNLGL